MVRRSTWPAGIGATIEWQPGVVDPAGSGPQLPKYGVFAIITDPIIQGAATRIAALARADRRFAAFKTSERYWPFSRYAPPSADWWARLGEWRLETVRLITDLWPEASALIETGLVGELR